MIYQNEGKDSEDLDTKDLVSDIISESLVHTLNSVIDEIALKIKSEIRKALV